MVLSAQDQGIKQHLLAVSLQRKIIQGMPLSRNVVCVQHFLVLQAHDRVSIAEIAMWTPFSCPQTAQGRVAPLTIQSIAVWRLTRTSANRTVG